MNAEYNEGFWLEENVTELSGTGLECPECGSELMFNDNAFYPTFHHYETHDVKCSNDACNYRDRIRIQ
jgi:C4-type Zn-finger protein